MAKKVDKVIVNLPLENPVNEGKNEDKNKDKKADKVMVLVARRFGKSTKIKKHPRFGDIPENATRLIVSERHGKEIVRLRTEIDAEGNETTQELRTKPLGEART